MSTTAWVVLGVVVVIVIWAISIYNGLVAMRQRVNQAFADVDVQLKQRHDLIPNLVETVKGYAAHERGTLEAVIQARNTAMAAPGRRGPDPSMSTTRASATRLPCDRHRSRSFMISFTALPSSRCPHRTALIALPSSHCLHRVVLVPRSSAAMMRARSSRESSEWPSTNSSTKGNAAAIPRARGS